MWQTRLDDCFLYMVLSEKRSVSSLFIRVNVMKNGLLIAIVVVALIQSLAFADGPGWTVNSTVTKLVVTADGGINVRLSPDVQNCISQSGYGPHFVSVLPTHPGINRIKADLLAAYLNEKTVSMYLNDSSCTATEILHGGW